jgi:hypothetical protein
MDTFKAIMDDMGYDVVVRVWVDSSWAKSIASWVGLGVIRHTEVKLLWIQDAVKDKNIQVRKIRGDGNSVGNLTKPKTVRVMRAGDKLRIVGAEIMQRYKEAVVRLDGWRRRFLGVDVVVDLAYCCRFAQSARGCQHCVGLHVTVHDE